LKNNPKPLYILHTEKISVCGNVLDNPSQGYFASSDAFLFSVFCSYAKKMKETFE
jgi:hypothetical protein